MENESEMIDYKLQVWGLFWRNIQTASRIL